MNQSPKGAFYKKIFDLGYPIVMSLLILVSIGLMSILANRYYYAFKKAYSEEINSYLSLTAEHVTYLINNNMETNIRILESVSTSLIKMNINTQNDRISFLTEQCEQFGFTQLSLCSIDGKAIDQNRLVYDMKIEKHIISAVMGKSAISDVFISSTTNEKSIEYAAPIFSSNNQVLGILVGRYSLADFAASLNHQMLYDTRHVQVVNTNGSIIYDSEFQNIQNLFLELSELLSFSSIQISSFINELELGHAGVIEYVDNSNQNHVLCYQPLGINGWYVVVRIPTLIVDGKMKLFINGTLLIALAIAVIITMLMLILIEKPV